MALDDILKLTNDLLRKINIELIRERKNLSDRFSDIEGCFNKIIEKLANDDIDINTELGNLEVYLQNHASLKKDISQIGNEDFAEKLMTSLHQLQNERFIKDDIPILKKIAGNFEALAKKALNSSDSIITRRDIIIGGVGLLSGGLVGYQLPPLSGEQDPPPIISLPQKVKWKLLTFLGQGKEIESILSNTPQKLKKHVEEMTDGNFAIDIIRAEGPLISSATLLSEVDHGMHRGEQIDCCFSGIYYSQEEDVRPLYFSIGIPFGLNPEEQTAWLHYKDNDSSDETYMQKVYSLSGLKNIIAFPAAATGAQMGGWFKKEVKSIKDLQQIANMRIPGLGAKVLEEMGVNTKSIPAYQIKDMLKSGQLDAAEWTGPYDDMKLGLHEVAKYYYYPGWWEPGSTFDIQVNRQSWEKLSKDYQEIFKSACSTTYMETFAEYNIKNSIALKQIRNTKNIKVMPFSEDIMMEARKATTRVLDKYSKNSPNFREVYMVWKGFRDQIKEWSELAKRNE